MILGGVGSRNVQGKTAPGGAPVTGTSQIGARWPRSIPDGERVDGVLEKFSTMASEQSMLVSDTDEYVKAVLRKAVSRPLTRRPD